MNRMMLVGIGGEIVMAPIPHEYATTYLFK